MGFKIINKRIRKKSYETSVLLPIREDKKIHKFLSCLARQRYKDFILLIANDSRKPYLKDEDFPKNLDYVYYHSQEEKYSTFDKLNFLAEKTKTKYSAITESDCEPSPDWLSDLIPIVKEKNIVVKGCEARPIGCCTANLVFPSSILKKIRFDVNIPIVGDFEWGMNLEKHGHPVHMINNKGLVFHNLVTGKARLNRIIPCARDDVYMAFKYKNPIFLAIKILRNGYNIFFGISQILLYMFYVPYFLIKFLFRK